MIDGSAVEQRRSPTLLPPITEERSCGPHSSPIVGSRVSFNTFGLDVGPRALNSNALRLSARTGEGARRFVRRWDRACRSHGHRPRQGAALFVGRAGEQHWVPAIRVFSGPGASRSVRAARKHSGSPRSEDLPSVALNTQRALCEPVHRSPFPSPIIDISKIPCKFPANSLLPQKIPC